MLTRISLVLNFWDDYLFYDNTTNFKNGKNSGVYNLVG